MRNMKIDKEKLTLKYLYGIVVEIRSRMDTLESKTHAPHLEMRDDVTTLVSKQSDMETDIVVVKESVQVLKDDMAVVKKDIQVLKDDMVVVKESVQVLKDDIVIIKVEQAEMKKDIQVIKAGQAEMKEEMTSKLDKVASDMSNFKDTVYKWGVGLVIGTLMLVASMLGGFAYYMHLGLS